MRPETLQSQLQEILENSFVPQKEHCCEQEDEVLSLSETEMFKLWNLLGEELGIDLSLVTPEQRKLLFEECENGKKISPKKFGSLLWLVYYSSPPFQ